MFGAFHHKLRKSRLKWKGHVLRKKEPKLDKNVHCAIFTCGEKETKEDQE